MSASSSDEEAGSAAAELESLRLQSAAPRVGTVGAMAEWQQKKTSVGTCPGGSGPPHPPKDCEFTPLTQALDALERGSSPPSTSASALHPPPPLPAPAVRVAAARGAYAQLQHAALRAVSDLAALQQHLAGLLVQVQAVRTQVEWQERGITDPIQLIDQVRDERDRAAREVGPSGFQLFKCLLVAGCGHDGLQLHHVRPGMAGAQTQCVPIWWRHL